MSVEGYVYFVYGSPRHLKHALASLATLRRHDARRPVALFCSEAHRHSLEERGLETLFDVIQVLPEAHQSIIGFKHHLYRFMPFDRNLFVDSDTVWCRNPDPLWQQLAPFSFTTTGLERADFFFGGPKNWRILFDILLDRRRRTLDRFGLTHLPRVQSGLMYAQDYATTRRVCETAAGFKAREHMTHFHSRRRERGRSEESCEWSLAMAMSKLRLSIFPWLQHANSPQLDFVEGLTDYDPDFLEVSCRYYTDRFVYNLRGLPSRSVRRAAIAVVSRLPGRGDFLHVTPFVLHFGWINQKAPLDAFAERTWERLAAPRPEPVPHSDLAMVG